METMRQSWTDERLDDLNAKIDRGFDRVEVEMRAQRQELSAEIGVLRAEANARFDRIDARFETLNRTLMGFAIAIIIALAFSKLPL